MGIEIDLVSVWVVEIYLTSVWGIEIDLMSVQGSDLTWFLSGGRNDLVLVSGLNWTSELA